MSEDAVRVTGFNKMKIDIYYKSGSDYVTLYLPGNKRVNVYHAVYLAVVDHTDEYEFTLDPFSCIDTPAGHYRGVAQNDCVHYNASGDLMITPTELPNWYWDPPIGTSALYFTARLEQPIKQGAHTIAAWWYLDNPRIPTTQSTPYGNVECRVVPDGQEFRLVFSYRNRYDIPTETRTGKFTRRFSITLGAHDYNVDEIRAEVRRQLVAPIGFEEYMEYSIDHDESLAFGNLALSAAESVRFTNINGIAYVKDALALSEFAKVITDVGELGGTLADIAKTANSEYRVLGNIIKEAASRGPRGVTRVLSRTKTGKALKLASSAYLAIHYGAKLGYKDTLELASSLDDLSESIGYDVQTIGSQQEGQLEFGTSTLNVTTRLTAYVDRWSQPQGFLLERLRGVKRAMYELDVAPTLANIWDLLPWTFVIDWFLPVGDIAERMELESYMQTFNVRQCFCSYKAQWETDQLPLYGFEGLAVKGKVHHRFYKRMCSKTLPQPPPPDLHSPLKDLPRHFVEGTALTISRLKR